MSRKNCYKIEAESLNLKEKQQNKQSLKFFIFSPLFSNVKRGKWKLSPAHYLQVTHQRLTLHNPHGALCCHWTWCSLPLGYTLRLKRRGNFHSFTSHIRNTSSLDTKHAHTLEQPDVSAKCLRFGWPRVCKKAQRGLGRNIFRFSSVTLWFLWDWGSDPKTVELQSGHNTCILSSQTTSWWMTSLLSSWSASNLVLNARCPSSTALWGLYLPRPKNLKVWHTLFFWAERIEGANSFEMYLSQPFTRCFGPAECSMFPSAF